MPLRACLVREAFAPGRPWPCPPGSALALRRVGTRHPSDRTTALSRRAPAPYPTLCELQPLGPLLETCPRRDCARLLRRTTAPAPSDTSLNYSKQACYQGC